MDVTEAERIYGTLTPFQKTIVELLIARFRLGETVWTLDSSSSTRTALEVLYRRGLANWKHGIVENSTLAWLTEDYRRTLRPYRAPVLAKVWREGYDAASSGPQNPYQR